MEDMRVARVTPPGRFAVARCRPVPEGVACHVVRAGDDEVSEVLLGVWTPRCFPGRYSIRYDAHGGSVSGPFEWRIAQRGPVFDLNWLAGSLALAGFGFADPEGRRSLLATYRAVPRK